MIFKNVILLFQVDADDGYQFSGDQKIPYKRLYIDYDNIHAP